MVYLTSGDLAEVTGNSPNTLNEWCRNKVLVPAAGGNGTGDYRQFTVMQTIGLAVALKVYRSERSCALSYIGKVVAAFAALAEPQLLRQLRKGRTHLVGVHQPDDGPGVLLLDAPRYGDQVDVAATYSEVKQKVEQIQAQLAHLVPGGRLRGLAGAARRGE